MNKVFFINLLSTAVAYWFGLTQNLNKDKTFFEEESKLEIVNEISKPNDKATVIITKEEKKFSPIQLFRN